MWLCRLAFAVPLGLAFCSMHGCGKDDQDKARFNESLGGRAPTAAGGIDLGILQDPSGYRPATPGASGAIGGGGGPSAAEGKGGGAEADQAKKTITGLADSIANLQPATLLDAFDQNQIKALREGEFEQKLQGALSALDIVQKTIKGKVSPEEAALMNEAPAKLTAAFGDAVEVTMIDPENATGTLDVGKFVSALVAWQMESLAKGGQVPGAEGAPAAAPAGAPEDNESYRNPRTGGRVAPPESSTPAAGTESTPPNAAGGAPAGGNPLEQLRAAQGAAGALESMKIPLKKIDGHWRIVLPAEVGPDLAALLVEGADIANEAANEIAGRIDAVPANDPAALQAAMMQMQIPLMARIAPWIQRMQEYFAEHAAGAKKPDGEKKPEDTEKPADSGGGTVIP